MLALSEIRAGYGDGEVLHGVSLDVADGEAVCVMGPNGAGKSTLLKVIAGALPARSGTISWNGRSLKSGSLRGAVRAGIVLVPEGRHIFQTQTIRENLLLGAHSRRGRAEIEADVELMYEIFPVLRVKQSALGRAMSGGQQQMLAIARGLMSRPRLLLLDEPSLGLAPIVVHELSQVLRRVQQEFEMSLLIVEQNPSLALDVATRGVVVETGRVRFSGTADEIGAVIEREGLFAEAS